MTDSNALQIGYVKETTFGVTPTTPTVQLLPGHAGESLRDNPVFRVSDEITGSREILDRVRLDRNPGGAINFRLRFGKSATGTPYGFPDDWFQAALQSANWTAIVAPAAFGATFVPKGANPTPRITRTAGSFVTDGITVGSWILPAGAAQATNNAFCRVHAVSALTLEVLVGNAANDFVTEGPTAGVTLKQGSYIVNGSTQPSYSVIKRFTKLTAADYERVLGYTIGGFNLRWAPGDFVSGAFNGIAQSTASGNFTGTITDVAGSSEDLMNAVENVTAMLSGTGLGGAAPLMVTTNVTGFDFTVNNGLRGRKRVGLLGNESIGAGDFDVTGNLRAYYTNKGLLDAMLAKVDTNFAIAAAKNGKAYLFDVPSAFFTDGSRNANSKNTDVETPMVWGARRSPADNPANTMRIWRFF